MDGQGGGGQLGDRAVEVTAPCDGLDPQPDVGIGNREAPGMIVEAQQNGIVDQRPVVIGHGCVPTEGWFHLRRIDDGQVLNERVGVRPCDLDVSLGGHVPH